MHQLRTLSLFFSRSCERSRESCCGISLFLRAPDRLYSSPTSAKDYLSCIHEDILIRLRVRVTVAVRVSVPLRPPAARRRAPSCGTRWTQ